MKQRVVAILVRLDQLREIGQLDSLLRSGARFADAVLLLSAHQNGELPVVNTRCISPALIFERLWKETGCQSVIEELLKEKAFEFPVERAVFMTVPHRLMVSGSDRATEQWATRLCHRGD